MDPTQQPQPLPHSAAMEMRQIVSGADPSVLEPTIVSARAFIDKWGADRVIEAVKGLIDDEEYPVGLVFGLALERSGKQLVGFDMREHAQLLIRNSGCFERWKTYSL